MTASLPSDAAARKSVPVFSGCLRYFPRALAAVAALSKVANEQHNPGQPLHWAREKSADHHDALTRHLLEAGDTDTDGQRHSTKVAWRALAALELELEAAESIQRIVRIDVDGCVSSEAMANMVRNVVRGFASGGYVRREVPMAGGFMSPDEPGVIGN